RRRSAGRARPHGRGGVGGAPPIALLGDAAGTPPSAPMPPRFETDVVLLTIGAKRNRRDTSVGATLVRRPQKWSLLPRSLSSNSFCASRSTSPGGAAVVAKVSTPPATSSVPVAPTVVLAERTPTKWIMLKRK